MRVVKGLLAIVISLAGLFFFFSCVNLDEPCAKMACGVDQGENCGSCAGDYICSPEGQCLLPFEMPECEDKKCGEVTAAVFDGTKDILCNECIEGAYCGTDYRCVAAKWMFELDGTIEDAPIIGKDGTVYVADAQTMYAISPDGKEKWRNSSFHCHAGAIANDGKVLFSCRESGVMVFAPDDGSLIWSFSGEQYTHDPVVAGVANNGTIYATSNEGGFLVALDPGDGEVKWSIENGISERIAIGADDTVYATRYPFSSGSRELIAIDPLGQIKWSCCNEETTLADFEFFAVGADGTIYYVTQGGKISAVSSEGTLQWSREGIFANPLSIGPEGTIYGHYNGRDDEGLLVLDPNGNEKWRLHSDYLRDFGTTIIGADGNLYSGGLVAVSVTTQSVLWYLDLKGFYFYSAAVMGEDGALYVEDTDYTTGFRLYAVPTDSGGPAKSSWPQPFSDAQHTNRVQATN